MNTFFTHTAFLIFFVLCSVIVYENTVPTFSTTKKYIISICTTEAEQKMQYNKSMTENDYYTVITDAH